MVPGMGNGFLSGRFVSRQKVFTHGAHAAEFFATSVSANDSKYFLAVANLGDRKTNTYRTTSQLYAFDVEQVKLTKVQEMPTLGAIAVELKNLPKIFRLVQKIDRIAVVCDQGWIQTSTEIEGKLIPGLEMKSFDLDKESAALEWLEA